MKRIITIAVVLALALGFSAEVKAQQPSLADSVYLTIENNEDATGVTDGAFVVNVFVSFNTANMTGATFGITWDRYFTSGDPAPAHSTADWQFDSLVYQGVFTGSNWNTAPPPDAIADSLGGVTVGGFSFTGGVAPGSDQLMAKIYLSLAVGNTWQAGSQVIIDSTFLPPSSDFIMVLATGSVVPTFLGAKKVTFNDIKIDDGSNLPKSFDLSQNYPNPFNPSTKINYTLARKANVTLEVYNVLGQTVKTLVNDVRDPGVYEVTWEGDNDNGVQVASGMYFYKITAGDFVQTRKMVLMK